MSVDFTKEMKAEYTIIAPDIFPTHMELLEAVFRLYGYNVVIAKYEGQAVINTGLKYLHNDVCYPAICMLGQQLYALTCGDFRPAAAAGPPTISACCGRLWKRWTWNMCR